MMGLAKQGDLFACAINWVGVTDLDLLYGAHWSDQSSVFKRYGLPKILGDRKEDAAMLKANSPIHLADRITKPVLLAYGKRDLRVPIEHGERMRDALRAHNKQVEWVRYDEEGHGWHKLETNKDFWGRVERFLAQHLKG
jgi:dipeptidyl aminopeptidase/acylaminoacyl peptidase